MRVRRPWMVVLTVAVITRPIARSISLELRVYTTGYPPDVVMVVVVSIVAVYWLSVAPFSPNTVVHMISTVL